MSASDSFNNQVTYELSFIEPSPSELMGNFASFTSLPTRRELLLQNVLNSSKCHYPYFGTKKGESFEDW